MLMRVLIVTLLYTAICLSQTDVSGPVSGLWESSGAPYNVVGDLEVGADDTLVVNAFVNFTAEYRLTVYGRLEIDSATLMGPGEIFCSDGQLDVIRGAFVDFAEGIRVFGGEIIMESSEVNGTAGTALTLQSADYAYISGCWIFYSGDYGIKITNSDSVVIEQTTLAFNSLNDINHPALFIDSCSPQGIRNNLIAENNAQGIGVWALSSFAAPLIQGNIIQDNFTGITVVNASPTIEDNFIFNNGVDGNYNSGAGLYIGYSEAYPLINRNYIAGNHYGVSIVNDGLPNLGDMVNDWPGDDGENFFYNNEYDRVPYHIWNATDNQIMAQNNFWIGLDSAQVDATIHDDEEGVGAAVDWEIVYSSTPLVGDPTGDDEINILDVVYLLDFILQDFIPETNLFFQCDVNLDLGTDISDVIALIEMVLDLSE